MLSWRQQSKQEAPFRKVITHQCRILQDTNRIRCSIEWPQVILLPQSQHSICFQIVECTIGNKKNISLCSPWQSMKLGQFHALSWIDSLLLTILVSTSSCRLLVLGSRTFWEWSLAVWLKLLNLCFQVVSFLEFSFNNYKTKTVF